MAREDSRDGSQHCPVHGELTPEPTEAHIVKRAAHPRWTEAERQFLLASLGKLSGPEIGEALGRRHKAVKRYCEEHGISIPRVHSRARRTAPAVEGMRHGRRWSEEELADLEAGHLTMLYRTRGRWAVISQAKRQGSPVRTGDGFLSLRQVALEYGIRPNTVGEWLSSGELPAKRSGRMWRIDPDVAARRIPVLARKSRAMRSRVGWYRR